jgi:RecA/RadA recombinase
MAKKTVKKEGQLPDPFAMLSKIDKNVEIIEESAYSNIDDWIPSGNYILDACVSGSMFRGFAPCGRVTTLSGDPGTGKSYLACSFAREAQKKNYTVLYLDSEGAIDKAFVSRLGVDASKLIIKQVSTVLEVSQTILNLCQELEKQDEEYGDHNKFAVVLDSLGNLTTQSELDNTASGENKRDLKRAQDVKQLFRTCATPIARMKIPLVVVSHVYAAIGSYVPTNIVSGGSGLGYNSSVTLELSVSKLADKANDAAAAKATNADDVVKTGVTVTAKPKKSRFTIPRKVRFQIPYFKKPNPYVGLDGFVGDFAKSGICRGVLLTEKDYNKLPDGEKAKVYVFEHNGQTLYCQQKDTARGIVVKHLGEVVPLTELFTEKVFTEDYLKWLDDNVIRPAFELPDQNAFDDIKEIEDLIEVENSENE